jgi:hypothetical protein
MQSATPAGPGATARTGTRQAVPAGNNCVECALCNDGATRDSGKHTLAPLLGTCARLCLLGEVLNHRLQVSSSLCTMSSRLAVQQAAAETWICDQIE